jgi:hypothetical protein
MKTGRRIWRGLGGLLLAGALLAPAIANAWTPITESVPLKGTVHEFLRLTVSAPPPGVDLNDLVLWNAADGSVDLGPQIVQASDVQVETNNFEGERLTLYRGYMVHESNPAQQVQFFGTLRNHGGPAPDWSVFDLTQDFIQYAGQGLTDRDLYFAYDPPHYLEPGYYHGFVMLRVEAMN